MIYLLVHVHVLPSLIMRIAGHTLVTVVTEVHVGLTVVSGKEVNK